MLFCDQYEFQDAHVIRLCMLDPIFLFIHTIGAFLNWISNLIVLIANFNKIAIPSTALLLLLCVFDFINGFQHSVLGTSSILYGSYIWPFSVCQLDYFINISCSGGNLLTVASIAIERYLSAKNLRSHSWRAVGFWVVGIITTCVLIALSPYFIGDPTDFIILEESGFNCVANWSSTVPSARYITWLSLLVIGCSCFIVASCYFMVYRIFVSALSKAPEPNLDAQKMILMRCVIITVIFLVLWSGYLCKILYHLVTQERTSPIFASISTSMVILNSVINPLLMILLDNRVKQNVLGLLGYRGSTQQLKQDEHDTVSLKGGNQIRLAPTIKCNQKDLLYTSSSQLVSPFGSQTLL